jgi:hypothetical protein
MPTHINDERRNLVVLDRERGRRARQGYNNLKDRGRGIAATCPPRWSHRGHPHVHRCFVSSRTVPVGRTSTLFIHNFITLINIIAERLRFPSARSKSGLTSRKRRSGDQRGGRHGATTV